MLRSLWTGKLSFAETFNAKINTHFLISDICLSSWFMFRESCAHI